ncbi:shikimate kinase [Klebsiella pasteurii]|uniref:shikimate kinase n=1 Tax=Klebsiella pasteurii TaxID=2587529 RepID=UPI0011683163|nr:shikimate kinase [Klebsiella pasteurii]VUS85717.1 Shikimate kinase 2 [Klebsiella pasteurii]
MNTLFLIGPGGVGKSTVGALLAQAMSYRFIDLDSEFCEQILNIRQYIQRDGYERYVRENAALCSRLLAENPHEKRVVVLSSDFLPPMSARRSLPATDCLCGRRGIPSCCCRQRILISQRASWSRAS